MGRAKRAAQRWPRASQSPAFRQCRARPSAFVRKNGSTRGAAPGYPVYDRSAVFADEGGVRFYAFPQVENELAGAARRAAVRCARASDRLTFRMLRVTEDRYRRAGSGHDAVIGGAGLVNVSRVVDPVVNAMRRRIFL